MTENKNTRAVIAGSRQKRLSVEKMPMLTKFADEIADLAVESFRTRLSSPIQFRRLGISADSEEKIFSTSAPNTLAALLSDSDWAAPLALMFQANFVSTLCEAMLGADGSDHAFICTRGPSTIERGLIKCFADSLCISLNKAITPLAPANFGFQKYETRLDFLTLAARTEDSVVIRFGLELSQYSGEMQLVMPQRAFARISSQLMACGASQIRRPDPQWSKDFEVRVSSANVEVEAYAEIQGYLLRDVQAFVPGSIISLSEDAAHDITMMARGRRLFTCELGQSDGKYSVRIVSDYDPESARSLLSDSRVQKNMTFTRQE